MSLKDKAHEYLEQGFRPIPLGAFGETPPGYFIKRCNNDVKEAIDKWPKVPRLTSWKEYQDRDPTYDEVEKWWTANPNANIGILTGFEFYAVDADSPEAMDWCENNLPVTPWRVNTAQGRHYYYSIPTGAEPLKNSVGAQVKVDVRGRGGYVVAAGSTHSSGIVYQFDNLAHPHAEHYHDLPELTAETVATIKAYNKSDAPITPVNELPAGVMLRLSEFSVQTETEAAPTIEGGRNNECARLTGMYIKQGFAVSEVLNKIIAWNETNPKPLGEAELLRTVESIVKGHEQRSGERIPIEPPEEKKVDSLMFSLGELMSAPPAEPEPFWGHRLIFRGARIMIAGAPKIGKSRFALAMAVQACCGGRFLNDTFTRPLRVMWMQAEIHKSWLMDRVGQVSGSFSTDELALVQKNLILSGRLDLDLMASERDFQAAREALEQHRPDIWMVDPIINFSSAEENSNVEVHALLRRINQLATEFDCASVLVHHTKKPSQNKHTDFDQIRGASAFRGWFDTGVMLTGESTDPLVSWEARNTISPGAHMAFFDAEKGEYTARIIESEEQKEAAADAGDMFYGSVFGVLQSAENGQMSMQKLIDKGMETLNVDATVIRQAIASMIKKTGAICSYDEYGEMVYIANPTPQQREKKI